MTNWLVKRLQEAERGDIVIVAGSDGVDDTRVHTKDLTAEAKTKAKEC